MKLRSRPGFWEKLKGNDVEVLSTVKLPPILVFNMYNYETYVFYTNGNSEVVERYSNGPSAREGHEKWKNLYNLDENG